MLRDLVWTRFLIDDSPYGGLLQSTEPMYVYEKPLHLDSIFPEFHFLRLILLMFL